MQTTRKKVITPVLGLTYAPCMDTYTNIPHGTFGVSLDPLGGGLPAQNSYLAKSGLGVGGVGGEYWHTV